MMTPAIAATSAAMGSTSQNEMLMPSWVGGAALHRWMPGSSWKKKSDISQAAV